jgi:hypothetical protein
LKKIRSILGMTKTTWRCETSTVKLFVQMKGSRHVLLGEWIVSRKIDFKEDQPVQLKEIKKEPEKKK